MKGLQRGAPLAAIAGGMLCWWVQLSWSASAIAVEFDTEACSGIFAGTRSESDVASAFASAWAELLTRDRTLSTEELAWVARIAKINPMGTDSGVISPYQPVVELFDAAIRDGLASLETLSGAIGGPSTVWEETLATSIQAQARRILRESRTWVRLERAVVQSRFRTSLSTVSVDLGASPTGSPVQLRDGNVVVGGEDGRVSFLGPSGSLISQFDTVEPGRNRFFFKQFVAITKLLPLRGGGVLASSTDGHVFIFSKDGDKVADFWLDGWIVPPIQLRDGLIFIASARNDRFLIDETGERKITLSWNGSAPRAAPVQTPNGGIVLLIAPFHVVFLSEQGNVLAMRKLPELGSRVRYVPGSNGSNGAVVVQGSRGILTFFSESGEPIENSVALEAGWGESPVEVKLRGRGSFPPTQLMDGSLVAVTSLAGRGVHFFTERGELIHSVVTEDIFTDAPIQLPSGTLMVKGGRRLLLLTENGEPFAEYPIDRSLYRTLMLSDGLAVFDSPMGVTFADVGGL